MTGPMQSAKTTRAHAGRPAEDEADREDGELQPVARHPMRVCVRRAISSISASRGPVPKPAAM